MSPDRLEAQASELRECMNTPLNIGSRRELFVDDTLIDRLTGDAALKLNPPVRAEVVFQVRPPLENACSSVYSAFIAHEGRILLYYRGHYPIGKVGTDESQQQTTHVAFSQDGIHFERPELGLFDIGDGGRNNVVWQGIQSHNLIPFLDTNPACAPDERFKAVGGTGKNNLYGLVSPDGIHWRLIQTAPLAVTGAFDSANVAFWDGTIGRYRLFSRFFETGRGRAIQSCTSADFLNWSEPVPHQYDADAPVEQFYTNATTPVPGAEHILLSFPMRYVAERTTPLHDISAMDYPGNGRPGMAGMTDAVMLSSRDGVHWKRPFLGAWLRAGLDVRNWTHRNSCTGIGILPLREDEWSMYVSEHYGWPDNRLRRLAIRPWGFASVSGGVAGGSLITHPFVFSGAELRINFSTSAIGSVAISLLHADGRPIAGRGLVDQRPIYGDCLDQVVEWADGTTVADLVGVPIRLQVELKDADLYAFRFV